MLNICQKVKICEFLPLLLDNLKSPGHLRISLIFTNLLDIRECLGYLGPMKHEISWIFGEYKAQINCIFANIRDIQARAYKAQIICIFVNMPMRRKSQGYLVPLTHKPPVYLQISRKFGVRITCIFICKSPDICKSLGLLQIS